MFVYVIVNRENLKLYVGKTVRPNLNLYLKRKIRDALKGTYQGRSHLFSAMQKHISSVWSIHPLISDLTTNEELCHWEKVLIAALGTMYPEIGYNISQGGEGNKAKRTVETCIKISEASKKQWANLEQRQIQIGRMRGIKHKFTEDGYLRQLESNRRMWATPEKRNSIVSANLGRKHTPEALDKISESSKKLWANPEKRKAILASRNASKHQFTPERCMRISEAKKRQWADPSKRKVFIASLHVPKHGRQDGLSKSN